MIRQGTLSNGVTLLCDEVSTTETCSIGFWFPMGSRDESAEERGFAHFLEHMLFKGTEVRSASDIAVQIDQIGGVINAFTEKERTCFYCTLPAAHVDLGIEILCDLVARAKLQEDDLVKEKLVVSNEIKAAEDYPDEQGYQMFMEGLWPNHALSNKITGELCEVKRINRRSLSQFYKTQYSPNQLTVSVAGLVDFDNIAQGLTEFLPINKIETLTDMRRKPTAHISHEYRGSHFQQLHIYIGTTLNPMTDINSYFSFMLLSIAFGESMSSRLFQHVREDQGLCYSVESFRTFFSDIWMWGIYANALPNLGKRLLTALEQELDLLAATPLSSKEIEAAMNYVTGSMTFAKEDMETRMKRIADQYLMFGKCVEFEESAKAVRSVTVKNISELSSRLLSAGSFSLLAFGTKTASKMGQVPFKW